ncbi:MAG: hypothetical protein BCS36_08810 [Desulfovibrio sp. MES5]|nr:MAG: hypothetical protein BCS36_08810 [Desulfovibrio sp. MES5]
MVKNAKAVYMAGDGDPFFSRHYRTLIKRIRAVYPDKLFLLHTNGQLCNEKHCRELDLLSNIHSVIVSINAARENTYERIMCGARWKTLIKNLDFLLACREKGLLKKIFFSFVIQKSNYKEMAEFSEWAGSMDIEVRFTRRYRDKNTLHYDDEVTIFDEKNPDFKEFAHMLQHPALKTPLCWLDPESMSYLKHACK